MSELIKFMLDLLQPADCPSLFRMQIKFSELEKVFALGSRESSVGGTGWCAVIYVILLAVLVVVVDKQRGEKND